METKDIDSGFLQPSHCSVPGCFSMPIFAGLCNLHSTKGSQTQDRRGKPAIATDIPLGVTASAIKAAPIGHDRRSTDPSMSFKYPKYYKAIPSGVTDLDIYLVCDIFQVQDCSGALHHAIKKLLLPGIRTGGKSRRDDIKEARDTLTRWLEIHK